MDKTELRALLAEAQKTIQSMYFGGNPHADLLARITAALSEKDDGGMSVAPGKAVAAIYFDDSSDYSSALWEIVRALGGDNAVNLLEIDEAAAYAKYSAQPLPPLPKGE